jgi:hypothetical protein
VLGVTVVTRCDEPLVLEFAEQALDDVQAAIGSAIERIKSKRRREEILLPPSQ